VDLAAAAKWNAKEARRMINGVEGMLGEINPTQTILDRVRRRERELFGVVSQDNPAS